MVIFRSSFVFCFAFFCRSINGRYNIGRRSGNIGNRVDGTIAGAS